MNTPSGEGDFSLGGIQNSVPDSPNGKSGKKPQKEYLVERTVHELSALMESLDLTDGDQAFIQRGGSYSQLKKELKGSGYEAHHIPAQSLFEEGLKDELPTIAITKEDHEKTSSYRGRMGSKYGSTFPGGAPPQKHKESIQTALEEGFLAEMVRNEVFEFRRDYGTKYDGGLRQFIHSMIDYIKKNGIPKTKDQ